MVTEVLDPKVYRDTWEILELRDLKVIREKLEQEEDRANPKRVLKGLPDLWAKLEGLSKGKEERKAIPEIPERVLKGQLDLQGYREGT